MFTYYIYTHNTSVSFVHVFLLFAKTPTINTMNAIPVTLLTPGEVGEERTSALDFQVKPSGDIRYHV